LTLHEVEEAKPDQLRVNGNTTSGRSRLEGPYLGILDHWTPHAVNLLHIAREQAAQLVRPRPGVEGEPRNPEVLRLFVLGGVEDRLTSSRVNGKRRSSGFPLVKT